jgi:tetratricopeptide (TPR) repeat protein
MVLLGPARGGHRGGVELKYEVFSAAGQVQKGLDCCLRALAIIDEVHGPDSIASCAALGHLATAYASVSDWATCLSYLLRHLKIVEAHHASEVMHAKSLAALAELYSATGKIEWEQECTTHDFDQGLAYGKLSIPIVTRACGRLSKASGDAFRAVGRIYLELGRYQEAIPYLEDAFAAHGFSLGESDVGITLETQADLGHALFNSAVGHLQAGQYATTVPFLQQAYKHYLAVFGKDDTEYSVNCANLLTAMYSCVASEHCAKGEWKEARDYELLSLECSPGKNPNIALSQFKVGRTYSEQGLHDEATPYFEQAVAGWTQAFRTGQCIPLQRAYDDAAPHLKRALMASEGQGAPDTEDAKRAERCAVLIELASAHFDRMNCTHPLVAFDTSHGGFSCDDCSADLLIGVTMHGCRECNYDLCGSCYALTLGCTHPLAEFSTPNDGYCCDSCSANVLEGVTMHGCRKCDYDLCSPCHMQREKGLSGPACRPATPET